ncbi:uncharacterized protein BP5553_01310 [Venustampulla echinocandica]|uniref:Uncharacterized protein n=1 Tax=Venustampulla echinocandica TaxID=2656787 RepID=A0A370U0N0_9HELO|nr:uncharacterized protein BP5553_01310 [Venustampulla echinocandica]RDL41331.1 hypothetical protein BP5553_01310 [Venustampulla echinocandica]
MNPFNPSPTISTTSSSGDEPDVPLTIAARLRARTRKHAAKRKEVISNLRQRYREGGRKLLGVVIYTAKQEERSDSEVMKQRDEADDTDILANTFNKHIGFTTGSHAMSSQERDATSTTHSTSTPSQNQRHKKPLHIPNAAVTSLEQHHFLQPACPATKELPLYATPNALRRKRFREACDAFERKYRVSRDDPRVLARMRSPSPASDDDGDMVGIMRVQRCFNGGDGCGEV